MEAAPTPDPAWMTAPQCEDGFDAAARHRAGSGCGGSTPRRTHSALLTAVQPAHRRELA